MEAFQEAGAAAENHPITLIVNVSHVLHTHKVLEWTRCTLGFGCNGQVTLCQAHTQKDAHKALSQARLQQRTICGTLAGLKPRCGSSLKEKNFAHAQGNSFPTWFSFH